MLALEVPNPPAAVVLSQLNVDVLFRTQPVGGKVAF